MVNPYRILGIFYVLLLVALLLAKLTGYLSWAWWVVLLPLTGPIALAAIIAIVLIACLGTASANGENPFQ